MKLPLKEPTISRYLYINPETNRVHLLMPIMSGSEIGLDNTCKSVYSLQEFFGLMGANVQSTGIGALQAYKEALAFDLKYLSDSKLKEQKKARLLQIEAWLKILNQIKDDKQITSPLILSNPMYPAPVESLMQAEASNLYSIILRPNEQDFYLRTMAISSVFSTNHGVLVNGNPVDKASLLQETLRANYRGLKFEKKTQEGLIARVESKLSGKPVNFEEIRKCLSDEIKAYLGIEMDLQQTAASKYAPSVPMTQKYLDEQLAIDEDNPATHRAYTQGLLNYCASHLFDVVEVSPFYIVDKEERLSILTQFFLAEFNIACREQGLTKADFGQILEGNTALTQHLAETVKDALEEHRSVEDALIETIKQHQDKFKLTGAMDSEHIPAIKERFKSHYLQIKNSPHFDEFMLLSKKAGLFFAHQNCICTHFASFMQTGFFEDKVDESTQAFLQEAQQDFAQIEKPNNTIPHKNDHIHASVKEIELDLSPMDKVALQALYEDISTYPDEEVKQTLLAQLKQERPDFKPQIDAKAFLQHVAYGEQKEAKALLEKDPELAQELLKANNIPFTDYSGRTFSCSAYEYAYWAKDSHMQRMLEKYIRKDEGTREFILERVKAIEEPMNLLPASGLFEQPKARGLHYTTQDKNGQTIDHWETHFSLKPLKTALKHYIQEYDSKTNKTEADWEALDKIWIEEVGGAQRNVPAHIAQEYCHPDRSFYDVNNNPALLDASNSKNLKRQLKFVNFTTGGGPDLWFSPGSYLRGSGLGFSFGILRGGWARGWGHGVAAGGVVGGVARVDLNAVKAVDEVRTKDLKRSLENLNQSLTVQTSPPHGI